VRLVDDDQVVDALPAQGPDQPFGDGVRARRPDRREQGLDAETARPRHDVAAVDRVAVAHQVARRAPPRRGRDQLPPDPGGGRTRGHVQVDELPPGVIDETSTYEVRNVSVWTVRRSAAQRYGRWLARTVRHRWVGGHVGARWR
jgi:hypothetical protein